MDERFDRRSSAVRVTRIRCFLASDESAQPTLGSLIFDKKRVIGVLAKRMGCAPEQIVVFSSLEAAKVLNDAGEGLLEFCSAFDLAKEVLHDLLNAGGYQVDETGLVSIWVRADNPEITASDRPTQSTLEDDGGASLGSVQKTKRLSPREINLILLAVARVWPRNSDGLMLPLGGKNNSGTAPSWVLDHAKNLIRAKAKVEAITEERIKYMLVALPRLLRNRRNKHEEHLKLNAKAEEEETDPTDDTIDFLRDESGFASIWKQSAYGLRWRNPRFGSTMPKGTFYPTT
eukprot:scaffold426486_cov48-Prasinocladus_malaysianus.AAC.2